MIDLGEFFRDVNAGVSQVLTADSFEGVLGGLGKELGDFPGLFEVVLVRVLHVKDLAHIVLDIPYSLVNPVLLLHCLFNY